MKYGIYAVYDRRALLYKFPNFSRSEAAAVRSFQTAVADKQTEIA